MIGQITKYILRRIFFACIMVALLLIGVLGCGRQQVSKKKIFNVLSLAEKDNMRITNELVAKFEAVHPEVKVRVDFLPTPSDIRQKILMFSSANMPLDVVYLNDTNYPEFVSRGLFEPLDSFMDEDKDFNKTDFHKKALECATFNDKIYSLPPIYGTMIIFYNRAHFRKAGLPYPKEGWSWEDFRQVCRKLTVDNDGDGKTDQFACAPLQLWFWLPMIFQNGGQIVDVNGRCVLNVRRHWKHCNLLRTCL